MRILAIEDDVDQRELIRETLSDHFGAGTVTCALSGQDAVGMDLSSFDAILTDFNLPDISGLELLNLLLSRCDKPIIVVTGENDRSMAVQAIRAGAFDYIVKTRDYLYTIPLAVEKNVEVHRIKQENRRLQEQQQRQNDEIQLKNKQLNDALQKVQQMAATDPLTGLYNRRHFNEVLERHFAEAGRFAHDLACIMIDLDGYKKLNDTLGHQFGDRILKETASVITSNLRVMDVAARYGGDEFVVLVPHATAELACSVGERIAQQFALRMQSIVPGELRLSMSMGIASCKHNHPRNSDQLVAFADEALYSAKNNGKNRAVISTQGAAEAPFVI